MPTSASDAVWRDAIQPAGAPALLFLGHTHEQFVRQVDGTTIVNPGSLGLPIDGDARAAFAVVDDGRVAVHRLEYDTERAAARVEALPLDGEVRQRLAHLIRRARLVEAGGNAGQGV
ncbi:MAG: metallophosphoesterase family protein [Acidobacteria bacterium]|nr:metallophosphoesterase family protein [Acidobacteriota bacterium]